MTVIRREEPSHPSESEPSMLLVDHKEQLARFVIQWIDNLPSDDPRVIMIAAFSDEPVQDILGALVKERCYQDDKPWPSAYEMQWMLYPEVAERIRLGKHSLRIQSHTCRDTWVRDQPYYHLGQRRLTPELVEATSSYWTAGILIK